MEKELKELVAKLKAAGTNLKAVVLYGSADSTTCSFKAPQ